MENKKYVNKITWARNAVVPLLIFSLTIGITQFLLGFFRVKTELTQIPLIILAASFLSFILTLLYLRGFWALADKYGQKAIKAGAGMIIALGIVSLALTLISLLAAPERELRIWIGVASIALIAITGVGYIVLGAGLRKLEPQLGKRAKSVGLLNLWGGIALATVILVLPAVVVLIISYILSLKLFNDEIKKATVV